MYSDNRVLDFATMVQGLIDSGVKPDGTPLGDLEALESGLALSFEETFAYKERIAVAQLQGVLSLDEAMTCQAAISGAGGWGEGVTLPIKVAVTQLMGQLVGLVK